MRVLSIPEIDFFPARHQKQSRKSRILMRRNRFTTFVNSDRVLKISGYGLIITRRRLECAPGQAHSGFERQSALAPVHLVAHKSIVRRISYNRDVQKILCGGPDHRWAADVDVLNRLIYSDIGPRDCLDKRIEVHYDHVDIFDMIVGNLPGMLMVIPYRENSTMHLGMQRLHPAAQDLRKPRQIRNISDLEAGFPEGIGCASS